MKRPFISILSGNAAGAALGLLLSAALVRLLDVPSFGRLNFILATSLVLAAVFDCGFSNTMVIMHNRFGHGEGGSATIPAVHGQYLRALPLMTACNLAAIGLVAATFALDGTECLILLTLSLSAALYRYANSMNQALGNWRAYSLLQMASNLTKLLLVPAAIAVLSRFSHHSYYQAALAGYALQAAFLLLLALWCGRRELLLSSFAEAGQRRQFYGTLIPIGLILLISTASMRLDVFLIKKSMGDSAVGIYTSAVTLVQVFPLVTGSLMDSLLGTSSQRGHDFLSKVDFYQRRYFWPMLLCFALLQLAAAPVITLCFGTRYVEAIGVFRVLLFPFFWGMFFTPLETYFMAHHSKEILYLNLMQIMVIAAGSVLLIPALQLYAVAWAIALSRILRWGYFYARRCAILRSLPAVTETP